MNANLDFDTLIEQLPEPELWRLLQDVIAQEIELEDGTIRRLDGRMQGFLFTQEYVTNRVARIDFATSPQHMAYLRDAAGSRNVWMTDDEFTELVARDDAATLACFARSEQMRPHHLAYIEHKLSVHPHGNEMLATSYDASITIKKAVERGGNARETALFRLAKAALDGPGSFGDLLERRLPGAIDQVSGDPRALWQAYLNLVSLDEWVIRELLDSMAMSTSRLLGASRAASNSLH
jgi:hypothetical protein